MRISINRTRRLPRGRSGIACQQNLIFGTRKKKNKNTFKYYINNIIIYSAVWYKRGPCVKQILPADGTIMRVH